MSSTFKYKFRDVNEIIDQAYNLQEKHIDLLHGRKISAWLIGPLEYASIVRWYTTDPRMTNQIFISYSEGRANQLMGIPIKFKLTDGIDVEIEQDSAWSLGMRRATHEK